MIVNNYNRNRVLLNSLMFAPPACPGKVFNTVNLTKHFGEGFPWCQIDYNSSGRGLPFIFLFWGGTVHRSWCGCQFGWLSFTFHLLPPFRIRVVGVLLVSYFILPTCRHACSQPLLGNVAGLQGERRRGQSYLGVRALMSVLLIYAPMASHLQDNIQRVVQSSSPILTTADTFGWRRVAARISLSTPFIASSSSYTLLWAIATSFS